MKPLLKRPFTFWLGLVPLLFLLWAWVDSMHHFSALKWSRMISGEGLHVEARESIDHHAAGVTLRRLVPVSARHHTSEVIATEWLRSPQSAALWLPMPRHEIHLMAKVMKIHAYIIPHWLLILAYLLLWSLALAWRHRRLKRTSTTSGLAADHV